MPLGRDLLYLALLAALSAPCALLPVSAFKSFNYTQSYSVPAVSADKIPLVSFAHFSVFFNGTSSKPLVAMPWLREPGMLTRILSRAPSGACQFDGCPSSNTWTSDSNQEWNAGTQGCSNYGAGTMDDSKEFQLLIPAALTFFNVRVTQLQAGVACDFTLRTRGTACNDQSYMAVNNPLVCIRPLGASAQDDPQTQQLIPNVPVYFEAHPTTAASSLELRIQSSVPSIQLQMVMHETDTPYRISPIPNLLPASDIAWTTQTTDGAGSYTLASPSPRAVGTAEFNRRYFVSVDYASGVASPQPLTVTLTLTEITPSTDRYGSSGQFHVVPGFDPAVLVTVDQFIADGTVSNGVWFYFLLDTSSTASSGFSVGCVAVDGGVVAPELYLRLGNIPTISYYDVRLKSTMADNAVDTQNTRFFQSGPTYMGVSCWVTMGRKCD
jgi:hypothetical protein